MTKTVPLLHLVLTPHRSLGPRGFAILMSVTTLLCSFIALRFLMLSSKAWPVAIFMMLDILLLYGAFRLNYRSATEREDIWLAYHTLDVRQRARNGTETCTTLNPQWVRVDLEVLNDFQNRLSLVSHGRRLAVGQFLAPHERTEICETLQSALARLKSMSRSA
jgi:uncharacterized membrane protein